MAKTYQYKIYKPTTTTLYNYIAGGDFEGEVNLNKDFPNYYRNFWKPYTTGSGGVLSRSRKQAYPAPSSALAATFDGTSSYAQFITTFNANMLNVNGTLVTIGGWFSDNSWTDATQRDLIGDIDKTNLNGFGITKNHTAGQLSAFAYTAGGIIQANYALTSLSAGFHHITATFNRVAGTSGTVTLFVDGAQVATTTTAGATFDAIKEPTSAPWNIIGIGVGAIRGNTNPSLRYFAGKIAQPFLYDRVFSATEIAQLFNDAELFQQYDGSSFTTNIDLQFTVDFIDVGAQATSTNFTTKDTYVAQSVKFYNTIVSAVAPFNTTMSGTVKIASGTGVNGMQTNTAFPVAVSSPYDVSCYVKGNSGETITLAFQPNVSSATTKNITLNGAWQQVFINATTGASDSSANFSVYSAVANTVFFVDKVIATDGSTPITWFDRYTTPVGNQRYFYDATKSANVFVALTFSYLATWANEVTSDFSYSQEINTAGSQTVVSLARRADDSREGFDLAFQNQVQVVLYDEDTPNGLVMFTGYIADYKPNYTDDHIDVTVLGYGSELDNFVLEAGENKLVFQEDASGTAFAPYSRAIGGGVQLTGMAVQGFATASTQTDISSIELYIAAYDNTTIGKQVRMRLYDNQTAAINGGASLGTALYTLTSTSFGWGKFTFTTPIQVGLGQTYYFNVDDPLTSFSQLFYMGTSYINPYAGGYLFQVAQIGGANQAYGADYPTSSFAPFTLTIDAAFRINSSYGNTTNVYNSVDPSTILKAAITDYNRQGGNLTYDSSSIDMTGTTVSYTFNTSSILEVTKKVLELSPVDWYFYIDQATNKVHLHNKSTATKQMFILGKHFRTLDFEKRTENIVNTIYFTGGLVGSTNLFKKYVSSQSVSLYGTKLLKYTDNRVVSSTTADLIANTILGSQNYPEVRTTLEIGNAAFDIDSLKVGQIVNFRGFGINQNSSLWDVAKWDNSYWDFDITNPETLDLQIARLTYTPESVSMVLSTTPPDVTKRVEDIKRNLDNTNTVNNPTKPS